MTDQRMSLATLRGWLEQAEEDLRAFAVRGDDDYHPERLEDLRFDVADLRSRLAAEESRRMAEYS